MEPAVSLVMQYSYYEVCASIYIPTIRILESLKMWTLLEQVIYEPAKYQRPTKYSQFPTWIFDDVALSFFHESYKLKVNIGILEEREKKNRLSERPSECWLFVACIICRCFSHGTHTTKYRFAVAYLLRFIVLNLAHKNSNVCLHIGRSHFVSPSHHSSELCWKSNSFLFVNIKKKIIIF